MYRVRIILPLLFAAFSMLPAMVRADQVAVAVASNFLGPLKALAAQFERQSGHTVRVSGGSTGKLYAQIVNGAPYDVFLAANKREPKRLEDQGKAVAGTRFTYALGRLALWSADPALIGSDGAAALRKGAFRTLAIANPKTAPYGAAAAAVLAALGLDNPPFRVVRGENIGQAFQYTATRNADVGFVALSQVLAHISHHPSTADADLLAETGRAPSSRLDVVSTTPAPSCGPRPPSQRHPDALATNGDEKCGSDPRNTRKGSLWVVPPALYPAIEQQAVLLDRGKDNAAARAFLDFLKGPKVRQALVERYGYGVDDAQLAAGH